MLSAPESLVVIVDVQEKLVSLLPQPKELLKAVRGLILGSRIFNIPVIYTEQAPQKIGKSSPEIARLFKKQNPITKTTFSCLGEKKFSKILQASKRGQIIVAGIESHVCVYQTVRDLLADGYEVYVPVDAVAARREIDHNTALERMKNLGAALVTAEMVLCELLKEAKGPKFKGILELMKQN